MSKLLIIISINILFKKQIQYIQILGNKLLKIVKNKHIKH